jgi:hypothetical protein
MRVHIAKDGPAVRDVVVSLRPAGDGSHAARDRGMCTLRPRTGDGRRHNRDCAPRRPSAPDHNLSGFAGERLRSHGGFVGQRVPFLVSKPLAQGWCSAHVSLRNYAIFDAILNGVRT